MRFKGCIIFLSIEMKYQKVFQLVVKLNIEKNDNNVTKVEQENTKKYNNCDGIFWKRVTKYKKETFPAAEP